VTAALPLAKGQQSRTVQLDDVVIHFVEQGEGPLVMLVHGFPESWYSWRHQLPALAAAGYRAVAIDVRGYGRSSVPADIAAYRMVRLVADNVLLAEELGADQVVIVGHDWGAPISWTSALLRPDLFTALATLSVPYTPPSVRKPTEVFAELTGEDEFYMNYFQEPGRVEAEAGEDLRGWLAGFYYGASGDAPPESQRFAIVPKGTRMRDLFIQPEGELSWLPNEDLDFYVAEFGRTGVSGALNRYRNLDRDWEDLAAFRGRPVEVPTLFIGGERDGPTIWGAPAIARFEQMVPNLSGIHILPGAGHWLQQERPDEVNRLLVEWLAQVHPTS
jgi:pimeloyl-ACP methyl ester carboxylesterase